MEASKTDEEIKEEKSKVKEPAPHTATHKAYVTTKGHLIKFMGIKSKKHVSCF